MTDPLKRAARLIDQARNDEQHRADAGHPGGHRHGRRFISLADKLVWLRADERVREILAR